MADLFILWSTLTRIANAIREKSGSISKMTPAAMATKIATLVRPGGTLHATQDGTYDVTAYRSADLAVGGTGRKFSYGWNDYTGTLTIIDPDNPLPDGVGDTIEPLVLSSIVVTAGPNTAAYTEGDSMDLTGCVITANYTDGSSAAVTNTCVFSPRNGDVLNTVGTQTVNVTYEENGITATSSFTVTVSPASHIESGTGTMQYTWDDSTRTFRMVQTSTSGTDSYSFDADTAELTVTTTYEDTT